MPASNSLVKDAIPHSHQPSSCSRPWPAKHTRYLSEWTDDIVTVNVAHKSGTPIIRTWSLATVRLAVSGGRSPFRRIYQLGEFPHLIDSLKIIINFSCTRHHSGGLDIFLPEMISTILRIFIWMFRLPASRLNQLTREDVNELVVHVRDDGWWRILDYDSSLRQILNTAGTDAAVRSAIQGKSKINTKGNVATIDADALQNLIGLPFGTTLTPLWFIEEFAKVGGFKLSGTCPRKGKPLKSYAKTIYALNFLSDIPDGFDRICFFPFPDSGKRIAHANSSGTQKSERDGRTENLPLEFAVKIFTESIKWTYDYFPGILALCTLVRETLSDPESPPNRADARVATVIRDKYPAIRERYNLPFEQCIPSKTGNSIIALLKLFFTATTCLITTNHGRRKNEVNGTDKPYGVYFGCVEQVSADFDLSRIDIYVEKSLQDYEKFWCNKLVTDCIERLEQLHQCLRPLFSEPVRRTEDIAVARQEKLFVYRYMSLSGFTSDYNSYRWGSDSAAFFSRLGVPDAVLHSRSHPFRRIFCLLFVYRYDCPELLALSHHLGHMGIDQTHIYVTDPPQRKLEKRLASLLARVHAEENGVHAMLRMVRSEYVIEKIEQMLEGKDVGGAFPRLVLKFVKRLSRDAEFRILSPRKQAESIHDRLARHGYSSIEKEHGACLAGAARHTRRHSNCYRDGELHTEDASPKKCSGCIHHLTTNNYIEWLRLDAETSKQNAADTRLPPSLRRGAAEYVREIEQVAAGYMSMAASNKAAFVAVINGWSASLNGLE